jgi:lipase
VGYFSVVSDRSGLRVLRRQSESGGDRAPTVVLVHGSMDRATSFTRLAARLPDWTVIAYDRRGYAGSAGTGPPTGFDHQVEDLLEVLNGKPAVAFGHSFGGDVVLAVAGRHPALIPAALVWEPPQPWLEEWPTDTAAAGAGAGMAPGERAEWFMRRMVGDRIWERLPSSTQAQRRAEGHTLEAEMSSLRDGPIFDATRIRIPVLVGRGGRSRPHQRRAARELAAALPKGQLVEIPDAGHGAHLTHPNELGALLRRAGELAPGSGTARQAAGSCGPSRPDGATMNG